MVSVAALRREGSGTAPEVGQAVTRCEGLIDEELGDPVRAEVVRLVGDGLFGGALITRTAPRPSGSSAWWRTCAPPRWEDADDLAARREHRRPGGIGLPESRDALRSALRAHRAPVPGADPVTSAHHRKDVREAPQRAPGRGPPHRRGPARTSAQSRRPVRPSPSRLGQQPCGRPRSRGGRSSDGVRVAEAEHVDQAVET
jgi:hypothetical protein